MNKTLYVKDEDLIVWQEAEKLGASISPLITSLLRDYVASRKVSDEGFKRIEVLVRSSSKSPVIRKAFVGRWVISPDEQLHAAVFDEDFTHDDVVYVDHIEVAGATIYAVAETQKGKVAAFMWRPRENSSEPAWSNLSVYDSLEDFKNAETKTTNEQIYPDDIIAEVMHRMGQPYTIELDI